MNKTYYTIADFKKVPLHMLQDESTLCIKYDFGKRNYMRVKPKSKEEFPNRLSSTLALINPAPEDLTYLTLLGIVYYVETSYKVLHIFNTIERSGFFRIP